MNRLGSAVKVNRYGAPLCLNPQCHAVIYHEGFDPKGIHPGFAMRLKTPLAPDTKWLCKKCFRNIQHSLKECNCCKGSRAEVGIAVVDYSDHITVESPEMSSEGSS